MKIYHGSQVKVDKPEIRLSNRTLDYGTGFYATTSEKQAEDWVRRRAGNGLVGYVNVYELDLEKKDALKTLSFEEPTEEWVDFVHNNRTVRGFTHDFDIVYGPVANDRVYAAFALYEGGVISKQALIAELKTYKLVDQFLFHTERSLQALTFIEAKEIKL